MIFFVYLSILVLSCILYIYYIKKGKNILPLPPILTLAPTLPKPNNLISVVNLTISTSDDFYVSNSGHKITYDLIQTIKLSNPELIKNKTFSELDMIIQSNISEQHKNILNELRGIFSFVFIDLKYENIQFIRDVTGTKPLYFLKKLNSLFF